MYKIGLRDGSPVSVGRMMEVSTSDISFDEGSLGCLKNGYLDDASSTQCPDVIVSEADRTKLTAIVMLLTDDMILEVPVHGTDIQIQNLDNGNFISYSGKFVDASGSSIYCQVMDTQGAKTQGDKILVRFIHSYQDKIQ